MQTSISLSLTAKLKALYSSQNTLPKLIEDEQIKALSLDEYYVKLQILLSESNEADKAALRDKVIGEKKPIEIENIFKAVDVENKIRELLEKNYQVQEEIIDDIIKPLIEEENKLNLLYRNILNKSKTEIKHIAEAISRIQADIGKVLLLGGAGIGKTTLMHYLSYKWGKENLWSDKFDYVFRIKLKELLNENWSREYEPGELRQSKLACFIHYCLDSKNIEPIELINIIDKDKILLLLDGYDEVASLSQNNRDYRDIMEAIFQYKNVIMTSRPNAVIEEMSSRFDRKIENTGWDSEGIEKYVNKNFEQNKELGIQLKSFLNTHSQIKEICEVPINTALICLVWSDKYIRDKFQKNSNENFNISRLYQEVVVWLAKKYFQKFENETITNLTDEQILNTPELRFLQESAFEALADTGKLVTTQLIKAKLNNKDFRLLSIEKINKIGLLKPEGAGKNIIDLNHQFIHLTFQEFLAALHLKNHLQDEEEKSKAASFIGEHRNEPKYLMTLKFLAGIVSNNDKQEAVEIFWEAATCNVDGILELGIERKIILLMHLLAQSKINDEFDNRITYLKLMQKLVDDTILQDITIWGQYIIESGYLSERIVETVNEKLKNIEGNLYDNEIVFQETKVIIEIIIESANRAEWGNKTQIYEKLVGLLKIRNIQLQALVLQKLAQILDETIDKKVVRDSLNEILLLNTWALNEYVNEVLANITAIIPNLSKEILNRIQKIDDTKLLSYSLAKVVKVISAQKAFTFLKGIIMNSNAEYKVKYEVTEIMTNILNIEPNLAYEIFTVLKEIFINSKRVFDCTITKSLITVAKVMPSLSHEIFVFLGSIIKNPKADYNIRVKAVESIVEIIKTIPSLIEEAFTFLKEVIINYSTKNDVNYAANQGLVEIVKVQSNLAKEAFIFLKERITNPNHNFEYIAIVEIVKVKPSLKKEAFTFLKEMIINSNIECDTKSEAIKAITQIAKVVPTYKTFIFLKKIIKNSTNDDYDKYVAISNLGDIVVALPSLAPKAVIFLEDIMTNSNVHYEVRFGAAESMSKVVKANLTQKLEPIKKALIILKCMAINPDTDFQPNILENIMDIVKAIPSLVPEAFIFLKEIVKDSEKYPSSEAMEHILELIEIRPDLVRETFDFWTEIVTSPRYDNDCQIIDKLPEIIKMMPSLTTEAFFISKEMFLTSNDDFFISIVIDNMVNIVKVNFSMMGRVLKILKEILNSFEYGRETNYSAAEGLIEILDILPLNKKYMYINELLNIIYLSKIEACYEVLYSEAKEPLHKITSYITQEYTKRKNPKVIGWFNKSFKELPKIDETRIFLKEICKAILKCGSINESESEFILRCIQSYQFTFTVSVNRDHDKEIEGKIIFEDKSYEILKKSSISLEEFAKQLLAATDDPLAEQYKTHQPLFPSKGLGLKIAASDIMNVNSITDKKEEISDKSYFLSFVRNARDESIILLEERSVFGDHLIYKFNKDNFKKVATIYPAEIDEATIRQIFNESEYEELYKSVVQSKILELDEIFEHSGKLKENFLQNISQLLQGIKPVNLKLPYSDIDIKLNIHEKRLDDQDKDSKDSGTKQKAEINREVERLKKEHPKLYNYCIALFWNIQNIIEACRIAETEFFKNNTQKTIKDRIILFGTNFLKPVIKDLPFIGAMAEFITDTIGDIVCIWLEKRQDIKLKNNIISINDIIHHKIGMQDIGDYFKKIAIIITHARKNEIINPKEMPQPSSLVQKFQACIRKAGNMIYDKTRNMLFPEIIESYDKDNIAVQLALKDSIAFINYLYTNYDDILKNDFDLFEQCKIIVENGTLDALFA